MLKRSFGEANLTALVQPQFAAASDSRNKRRRVGDASIGASQGGGEEGGLGGGDKAAGVLSQPEGDTSRSRGLARAPSSETWDTALLAAYIVDGDPRLKV